MALLPSRPLGMLDRMDRRVVIATFADMQSLDAVGPLEVFVAAHRVLRARSQHASSYRVELVAETAEPFATSSGLLIQPHGTFGQVRGPIDTLVIAGGDGARAVAARKTVQRWVRRVAAQSRRVASVCTGAFVLAAAGLLDGRRCTTHWAGCKQLASTYPAVKVDPDAIYVRDGQVWTSAGVTAGMDLALALVEDDVGREIALTVARYLVMFVRRPGGQSQFSAQLSAQLARREPLRDLQMWISEHVEADLSVPALARRAGMSPRNFARVFTAELGVTPALFVQRVRVEVARRLLETTQLDLEAVAAASGLGTAHALRRSFVRELHVSPKDYRRRFQPNTVAEETPDEHRDSLVRSHHRARRHRPLRSPATSARRGGDVRRAH